MDYPAEISTFTVTGKLMYGNPDTADAGIAPDLEPVRGAGILFEPEMSPPIYDAPAAATVIYQRAVSASTDVDGNITGLLDATPDVMLPYYPGQTWRVTIEVPDFPIQVFSITGSPGGTVNIASVVPVPPDPGTDIIAWEAVVSEVTDARDEAVAAAGAILLTSVTFPAYNFGVRANTGTDQKAALHAAFAAAEAFGGGGSVSLPAGDIAIDGSFSLAGYSSGLVGVGGNSKSLSVETGTTIRAINQTGPVLDFTGYLWPNAQRGKAVFADFNVQGDGTAGTAKKGIYLGHASGGSSVYMRNVTVFYTGGTGLHVKNIYLSEFHGVTVCDPVNAATSDIPWVLLEGANGNRYYGLGLRSLNFNDAVADVGPSGALRLVPGTSFQHHLSAFYGTWFENLHATTNAAFVVTQSNKMTFSDSQFFDCFKVVGTTGTAHFRLEPPTSQDYGGNMIRGVIPGMGTNTNEIDAGVDLRQSANHIMGVKGYRSNNVLLASGVSYTFVMLGGAEVPANAAGIVDSSGNNTNTLIDMPQGTWVLGERSGGGSFKVAGAFQGDKMVTASSVTTTWGASTLFGHNMFRAVLGGNPTLTITTNSSQVGRRITVIVVQDATGSRTVTWPANVKFAGSVAPTLTTTANKTDTFTFVYDGTNWIETARALNVG